MGTGAPDLTGALDLTATGTGLGTRYRAAVTKAKRQAFDTHTIRGDLGYARPEKQTVGFDPALSTRLL